MPKEPKLYYISTVNVFVKNITITAIFSASIILMPSFVFADTPALPSQCSGAIGDYNIVDVAATGSGDGTGSDDFIFTGDSNSITIDGKGGDDCVLVGNSNSKDITVGGGSDVVIVGNSNSGQVKGQGGADIIVVGNNNTANIFGGGGNDSVTLGSNNSGQIKTEGGDDNIIVGCGHSGTIDSGGGTDTEKTSCLPAASPSAGTYTAIQNVSLASEAGASIYYTLDGTTPACSPVAGTLYSSSVSVFSTKTIKAISCSPQSLVSDVAAFNYTINKLEAAPTDLSTLLNTGVLVPASGTTSTSTSSITVAQNLEINVSASSGTSEIVLSQNTIITATSGSFNATALTSSNADTGSLAGLAEGQVFKGALQWGIPNITLNFNPAVTISIFVGTGLNGQTLNVVRSVNGSESWTSDGIISPGTCVVSNGICSFQAIKASYYAATGNTGSGSSGSSGGGSCINCIVMIGDKPVQPARSEPVSNKTEPVQENQENIAEEKSVEIQPAPTPLVTTVLKQDVDQTDIRELDGLLLSSDNKNRGGLMLISKDTTFYIKTSRDFSNSVGKNVSVSVLGTPENFTFLNMIEKNKGQNIAADAGDPEKNDDFIADNYREKSKRPAIVSLFASIGKLMFRGFDIFR